MCLLVLAWMRHPRYRLLVAANRDEYHARPSAPLAEWGSPGGIIGGRDLQADGTWLAVDDRARFGVVTNFREFGRRRRSAPSRGGLVPGFLRQQHSANDFLAALETDAPGFAGFNLLLADGESLWYACNRADQFARALAPGIFGLSNEFLDTPWPKLLRARERFTTLVDAGNTLTEDELFAGLFDLLADRQQAPDETLPAGDLPRELARVLSAPFVLDATYGTRCSTIVAINDSGRVRIAERRFDAQGMTAGSTEHVLNGAHQT